MQATRLQTVLTSSHIASSRQLRVALRSGRVLPVVQHRCNTSDFSKTDSLSSKTTTGFHGGSISQAIEHDHRELKDHYRKLCDAKDDDTKVRYQNQFVWELARHSIGEELVVYPAMEQYVQGGKDMADRDRMDHNTLKELLYKFQGMKPSHEDFQSTLNNIWQQLSHHIEDEEGSDLPSLERSMPKEVGNKLAKSFARTKMFVPTRSHPMAPDKPPFETVVGLMAAPIDKLGDMFRSFPEEENTSSR